MIYAGVGSREVTLGVADLMTSVAQYLATEGYTLRSGHANGSDKSFEFGCDVKNGKKEIYLPWPGFNGSMSRLVVEVDSEAYKLAKKFHPYWDNLSDGAKKLQARNGHQVLGLDLNTPADFIICWTSRGKGSGGTGQAIRIAKEFGVPVFDIGTYHKSTLDEIRRHLFNFILENKDRVKQKSSLAWSR